MHVVRFGLNRMHDELSRFPHERRDPDELARRVAVFLDELRFRIVQGRADECLPALEALATPLSAPQARSARWTKLVASRSARRSGPRSPGSSRSRCVD